MHHSLQYLHDDRKNHNNRLSLFSILQAMFLLMISGSKQKKSHGISIITPFNTYLKIFIYSPGTQEEFVIFHRIAAADASWYPNPKSHP